MLNDFGWSAALQDKFDRLAAPGLSPGRITAQHRGRYRMMTPLGESAAELSGRLTTAGDFAAVGDFVAADARAQGVAIIRQLLPRRTAFTRLDPFGRREAVAANVDVAFLIASLEQAPNLRRLERTLVQAWASGAAPVIVLAKADLAANLEASLIEVRRICGGAEVLAVSAVTGRGLEAVREAIGSGRTAVMIGASGAGKSTLANALLGEQVMAVGEVRADDKRGRHTTTHRQLMLLSGGGLLLDTPGIRELSLDAAGEAVAAAFDDVEALAAGCRFGDCTHGAEPGCQVRAALADGRLDEGRWRSFEKLTREAAHQARQEDPLLRQQARRRWITVHKAARARYRARLDLE